MNRTSKYPLRYLARVVIEFKTPFLIGSGQDDTFSDEVFVADVNGLPALPGSSIAGVLRHRLPEEDAKKLFGFQKDNDGEGSRITISWGCIHDQKKTPVEGRRNPADVLNDPVLRDALNSATRDHVRIGHRGAGVDQGKFDERPVAAGHRFTFEIMLEGNNDDAGLWNKLLSILCSGKLRFGGKTRRGFGSFEVESLIEQVYDLTTEAGFDDFSGYRVELSEPLSCPDNVEKYKNKALPGEITVTLPIEPVGFWLIGGGDGMEADMTPVMASRICWGEEGGKIDDKAMFIPGTAIKGPLAHRVAYYYYALKNINAEMLDLSKFDKQKGSKNKAVRQLFGYAKGKTDGRPGRVFIDDLFISTPEKEATKKILNHVSIDRFTGGARSMSGALFSESPLFKGEVLPLVITVVEVDKIEDSAVKKAFLLALRDLAEGQLSIGGGAGRGNGFFEATEIKWSDDGVWIGGGDD